MTPEPRAAAQICFTWPRPGAAVRFARALLGLLGTERGPGDDGHVAGETEGVAWTIEAGGERVSMAPGPICWRDRSGAPVRTRFLRDVGGRLLPWVEVGGRLHAVALHHLAAMGLREGAEVSLRGADGQILGGWSVRGGADAIPLYEIAPGLLDDAPPPPGAAPALFWTPQVAPPAPWAPDLDGAREAVRVALAQEPPALEAAKTALIGLTSAPVALEVAVWDEIPDPPTLIEAPRDVAMVVTPTLDAVRLSLKPELPAALGADLLLHGLGHVLLGHVRPGDLYAHWDTAATIRRSGVARRWDGAVAGLLRAPSRPTREEKRRQETKHEQTTQATAGAPELLPADGRLFQLALEARRLERPWDFDPFAGLRGADVDPLPHQLDAVYGRMLGQRPLRFLLADDPGAGKTIMAGLLIRERLLRGTLKRCLIVAPGSLVDQWRAELEDRFGLAFGAMEARTSAPFDGDERLLIARLDQLARNAALQRALEAAPRWDLVVCDESHKMSAQANGRKVDPTRRYRLGRLLGGVTDDLLMMTATPHNGIEASYQLSLALLDRDRFAGPYVEPFPQQDPSDLIRRVVKEELVTLEGDRLFPEREARTLSFPLSAPEQALYEAVTRYVRDEMNRAEGDADAQRRNRVGFAMQVLQRRLASSPRAIHTSLERRLRRLQQQRAEAKLKARLRDELILEDQTAAELESVEDEIVQGATNARSAADLRREIGKIAALEAQARKLLNSGRDTKWDQLASLLGSDEMRDERGRRRKLVVFTESRDTLEYLCAKLRNRLGRAEAVVEIHGEVPRKDRQAAIDGFMGSPDVIVLVANDAAGEGVNLQAASVLVNYDLPWNPNRLEQRFGRIHRIGQTETCVFWNLLARGTREGDVYIRLLEKLEVEREALGGKVYDVLGALFEDRPLHDLMKAAVQDRPAGAEALVDHDRVEALLRRGAGMERRMGPAEVAALRRRLRSAQPVGPEAIQRFFVQAFALLGGTIRPAPCGAAFKVSRIPQAIRSRDRARIARRYDRVVFAPDAEGERLDARHPLLAATRSLFLERNASVLADGAILLDPREGATAQLVFLLERRVVHDGGRVEVTRRFVAVGDDGAITDPGPAPHLAARPPTDAERAALGTGRLTRSFGPDAQAQRLEAARQHLIAQARRAHAATRRSLDRVEREVTARLRRAIEDQEAVIAGLSDQDDSRKIQRALSDARARLADLQTRLAARRRDLSARRAPPTVEVFDLARMALAPERWLTQAPDAPESAPTPHPVQQEALAALASARADGAARGLVVMATGLGKTWLSAFDFAQMRGERALFVAHREEILRQAAATWGRLLPGRRAGLLMGGEKDFDAELLFASVYTLGQARHLRRFAPDAFDYVVVDEFHHAAAATYRRVIGHFQPKFLLGMTATPDRTDGADLLSLCDGNRVFRASLVEGVSRGLLAPFRYFGVRSEIDYSEITWRSGRFDLDELTDAAQAWAAQAWDRFLERAGPAPRRALVFCCTVRHAEFMAAFLRDRGVAAAAVHSEPGSADRAGSLAKLRSGDLEAICCVDVFNEGVDLPEVDHVLMLRPTESPIVFLQQLGRGLRRAAGKEALTVVDFIGNHRSFLMKPAALLLLTGEGASPSASLQRIAKGRVRWPDGCRVEIETEAVDLLEQLSRMSSEDALLYEYADFQNTHGRRPTAGEVFAAGASLRAVADRYGSWFDFVAARKDLTEAEARALAAHRGWFDALWQLRGAKKKQLPSAFPLLALQATLDAGGLLDATPTDRVIAAARALAAGDPLLADGVDRPRPAAWAARGLRFWTDEGPADRRQFAVSDADWVGLLSPEPWDADALTAMTAELVDLLLRMRRHTARLKLVPGRGARPWLLKVSHAGGERPMLFLQRERNPGLPEKDEVVDVEIDGALYRAAFVKIALNVVTPAEGGENALPEILRRWFGPLAGASGSQHYVRLERAGEGYRMRPDQGAAPLGTGRRPGAAALPFFPDQSAACGLEPAADLANAAPVRVAVPGPWDPARHFLVKARGDSMDGGDQPIRDGDVVLCEWIAGRRVEEIAGQPTLLVGRNGGREPIVAIKTPVRSEGRWLLRSANPAVADQPVPAGYRLRPVGRVLGPRAVSLAPERWRDYRRPAVAALFGDKHNKGRWNVGHVDLDGMGRAESVLFVTLRKRDDAPSEHRYRDRFLSRTELQWESQASTAPTGAKGRRLIGASAAGRPIHLFVRYHHRDAFTYCGTGALVAHEGARPMRCRFALAEALPEGLWGRWR